MKVGNFSANNPVLVNILMFTILIIGVFSFIQLPQEQYAEVPFYWVNITVPYPGVGAEDIEQLITIPIENEIEGIDKIDEIQSISKEGLSLVSVRFSSDITQNKFDKLYQDVRTNFSRAEIPEGALNEDISSFSSNDFTPVIEIIVSGNLEYRNLLNTAESISNEISRISEVSIVELVGANDKEIVISADQSKLENYNITLNNIVNSLKARNINIPGGNVKTQNREYIVRTVGEVSSIDDFKNIVVNGIKIRNFATVSEKYNVNTKARFNKKESITIRVTKVPKGNSVKIADKVKEITKDYEKKLSKEIRLDIVNDSTIQIKSSLNILLNNALLGLMLLIAVLFFFVGLRNALMTGLGIPITFAITFIVLSTIGETFNSNTLFGMVLVLGLIVDHAIVIIENSFRLQQQGVTLKKAAINGVNQVVLPVLAATGTTVAAFLPLMILPGTIGKFLRVIPLTVSIALIASTFEALLILPSHYADWPGGTKGIGGLKHFNRLIIKYKKILSYLYLRKKRTVIFSFIIMVGVLTLTGTLNQDLFSAEDFSLFYIDIEMPPGTPIEKTDNVVKKYEDIIYPLLSNEEILSVSSSIGFLSTSNANTSQGNVAQILVDLAEKNDGRKRSISSIMETVKEKTKHIPGTDKVFFRKAVNGPPQDPPLNIRLFGNNLHGLREISERITEELGKYPVLLNIQDDLRGGSPELKILVNQEKAEAFGLSTFQVGQFISEAVGGITATSFVKNNQSINVIVKYERAGWFRAQEIDQLFIPTPTGVKIPFSSIAVIKESDSISSIKRIEGKRVVTISANTYNKEELPEINRNIDEIIKTEYKLKYPDIELVIGGEFAEFGNLLIKILQIFLIGIFLIYIILGTQFKSYTQPFLILFSVPMAFAGVILYLLISGTPFSTTVLYAGVALAGIAVNDAIVLISFINELKNKGKNIEVAIMEAATTRLRPIMLTSITTIGGLLPTAVGLGGFSAVWQPMASTIIFGLLFSTLTALILIPLLYGVFYDK